MPYFVAETGPEDMVKPIGAMPVQSQLGMKAFIERVAKAVDKGLKSCILFGIPLEKDPVGSQGYAENGVVQAGCARAQEEISGPGGGHGRVPV